jgi:hypothetical protein
VEIARKTKEEQKYPGVRLNTQWSRIAWSILASGTNNVPSRDDKLKFVGHLSEEEDGAGRAELSMSISFSCFQWPIATTRNDLR